MPGCWRVWRATCKPTTGLQSRFAVLMSIFLVAILGFGCYRYYAATPELGRAHSAESGQTARLSIIMSDSRNFSRCQDFSTAPSFCFAVVLNFLFAQRHGYGYTFYSYVWNSSAAAVLDVPAPSSPDACFHSPSSKARHAAWCKVLVCWVRASAERVSPEAFNDHLAIGPASEPWTIDRKSVV
jgi:hypothetical protein